MIPIGQINSPQAAQVFCDYLQSKSVEADWLPEGRMYLIRVAHIAQVTPAQIELREFLAHPDQPRFLAGRKVHNNANARPKSAAPVQAAPVITRWLARTGSLTIALTMISLVLTLATQFGENERMSVFFWFHWPSIMAGQWYRLITPIFLHMSFLHLFFNVAWLWDLGGIIEKRCGSAYLLGLILLIGILSNAAQYLISGPYFGGLSGIVYGLFAYIWIRGKYDARFGVRLPRGLVFVMLAWLVLCFTGWLGPIANAVHVVGLLCGMVFGLAAAYAPSKPSVSKPSV